MGHSHIHDHVGGDGRGHAHGLGAGARAGARHKRRLLAALVVLAVVMVAEVVAAFVANSLALLSDAGHMLTDSAALGLAALASRIALRPATEKHSFGLERAEALAAAVNALVMLAIVASIVIGAMGRLADPPTVRAGTVILVGGLGLVVNLGVAFVLTRGERTLNVRGALLHVMGDLLGSVAAVASGLIIWSTGWSTIDPVLSLVIAALILFSSLNLLRDVLNVFLEGVPRHVDLPAVGRRMAEVEGVHEVHDLHIWSISSSTTALSAHVVIEDLGAWNGILPELLRVLEKEFDIGHATLQPEPAVLARVPVSEIGRGH